MGAITAELVETGEKRDARGRRVTPAERRCEMVRNYQASGETMAAFARRERINYATFAGWVMKAQKTGLVAKPAIRFAEMRLPMASASESSAQLIEMRLPDGTVLRGSRVADVVTLVMALRS
jgi:transposase-like protein